MRTPTSQGVEVRVQGEEYRPYCNVCPWMGQLQTNMAAAQQNCRQHHREEHDNGTARSVLAAVDV